MIECYTWTTDNGYKPRMMLEETGLPHKIIPVNIREKEKVCAKQPRLSSRPSERTSAFTRVFDALWSASRTHTPGGGYGSPPSRGRQRKRVRQRIQFALPACCIRARSRWSSKCSGSIAHDTWS